MGNELLDDIAARANRSIEQVADELVDASEAELDATIRDLELLRRRSRPNSPSPWLPSSADGCISSTGTAR